MNFTTEPIRDRRRVNEILSYMKGSNYRNYVMAKIQLNTGLRISDVLKLKVKDFIQPDLRYREYITLHEKKTSKEKKIAINKALKDIIKDYILKYDLTYNSYLFPSPKKKNAPISRTQAHRIYENVAKALHLDNFNSHSLRKTWGYFAYKETQNIALLMDVYNHSSAEMTLRYIGINQDDKNSLYHKIKF